MYNNPLETTNYSFFIDNNYKITAASEDALALMGFEAKDIIGSEIFSIFKKKDLKDNIDSIFKSNKQKKFETMLLKSNGEKILIQVKGISLYNSIGKSVYLTFAYYPCSLLELFNSIDPQKYKKYKKYCYIDGIKKHFDIVQQVSNIGIWEIYLKDKKYYWSDNLYKILGIDIKCKPKENKIFWRDIIYEILNLKEEGIKEDDRKEHISIHPDDKARVVKVIKDSFKNKKDYKLIFRVYRPDGELRYVQEEAVFLEKEKNPHVMGVVTDVTKRELFQKELVKQTDIAKKAKEEAERANSTKNIFISNISHDIRTLMNAILGYSQILSMDEELNDKQKDIVDTILISSGHLLDLMNDIINLTKMEGGEEKLNLTRFNLSQMLKSIHNIFKIRAKNNKIFWFVEGLKDNDITVETDKNKLFHTFINLVSNAIKFTEKGSVKLKLILKNDGICTFEVEDTGIGIDLKKQKKIFKPFTQDMEGFQRGGSGLGLSIATRNVEILGSKLKVDSKLGKGSKFYFSIKCEWREENKGKIQNDSFLKIKSLKKGENLSILVADDIIENRHILNEFLGQKNIDVILAENGKEAVLKYKKYHPHLVLMDLRMPVMNGVEAAKKIKEIDMDSKIIAITASVYLNDSKDNMDIFDSYILKPFYFSDIDKTLLNFTNKKFILSEGKDGKIDQEKVDYSIIEKNQREIIIKYAQIGHIKQLRVTIESLKDSEAKQELLEMAKSYRFDEIAQKLRI